MYLLSLGLRSISRTTGSELQFESAADDRSLAQMDAICFYPITPSLIGKVRRALARGKAFLLCFGRQGKKKGASEMRQECDHLQALREDCFAASEGGRRTERMRRGKVQNGADEHRTLARMLARSCLFCS